MQLITGTWNGALMSEDGRLETSFSLSQPGGTASTTTDSPFTPPAMTFNGSAPTSLRLLEGARNVLVGLADSVPDPVSGSLAQVLLDVRVLGDRLVGRWLRRDVNGVTLSMGNLVAPAFRERGLNLGSHAGVMRRRFRLAHIMAA